MVTALASCLLILEGTIMLAYADETLRSTRIYGFDNSDRAFVLATDQTPGRRAPSGAAVAQSKAGATLKTIDTYASSEPIKIPERSTPPALYTERQSVKGGRSYRQHCARCHGQHLDGQLEGGIAPALRGAAFAGPGDSLRVSEIFRVIAKRMPASSPGSLQPATYVEIMAYILQKNGYPPGRRELTYGSAETSQIPFVTYKPQPVTTR